MYPLSFYFTLLNFFSIPALRPDSAAVSESGYVSGVQWFEFHREHVFSYLKITMKNDDFIQVKNRIPQHGPVLRTMTKKNDNLFVRNRRFRRFVVVSIFCICFRRLSCLLKKERIASSSFL